MFVVIETQVHFFIVIALFVLGLHNVVVYAMRRKERAPLFFAFFCLLFSFNTWISGPAFTAIFPSLSLPVTRRLDLLSLLLTLPCFIRFTHLLFPDESSPRFSKVVDGATIPLALSASLIYQDWLEYVFLFSYPVILAAAGYCTYVGIRAVLHKRRDARPVLWGILILSLAGAHDILWALHILDTMVLMPLATLCFTLIYSMLLSKRFAVAFAASERLSIELVENERLKKAMEQKIRQEQKLRQTQHRLTALLHTINAPLCAVNESGTIEFCNHAFEEHIGSPLEMLAGKPLEAYLDPKAKAMQTTTVNLELEEEELTVYLLRTAENPLTQNISAIHFIEALNKNRLRIQSLETLLSNTTPDSIKHDAHLSSDLESIDKALEQMEQILSTKDDIEKKNGLGSELMTLALQYWSECTGESKVALARESGLWAVHINPDGWERTQTLDRYLQLKSFPKLPRWNKIVKTADFVLIRCTHPSPTRTALENTLQKLLLLS